MRLISIVIPYFKKKNYIEQTLRSILRQKYKHFEVLIVYDDEDQSDLTFVKTLIKNHKHIRLIINKKNIGAGMSRNKAIKLSKGEYIAFLDSDDLWHPNKLKIQLDHMIKNKISISHTSYNIIDEKNFKFGFREAKKLEYKDLLKSCDVGLSTVMIKKKILKNNLFAKLKTKEDYILWLKLSKKGFMFHPIKKPFTSWRALRESLSSSTVQKLIDGYYVYRYFLKQSFLKSIISLSILSINFLKKW
jgi:teichuronic acid biosynthesis glycosyltransferase TuaG